MTNSDSKPAYSFIKYEEYRRATKLRNFVMKKNNKMRNSYKSQYELDQETAEKKLIDEINRQNLTSGYGV